MKNNPMKKRIAITLMAAIVVVILSGPTLADKYANTIEVFKKSEAVKPFFKNSYGYAVFPVIGKAGIGIGGSYGTGRVYPGRQGHRRDLTDKSQHWFSAGRPGIQPDDFF